MRLERQHKFQIPQKNPNNSIILVLLHQVVKNNVFVRVAVKQMCIARMKVLITTVHLMLTHRK
jgi:hypothetical protein